AAPDPSLTMPPTPSSQSRAKTCHQRPIARSTRRCSNASSTGRSQAPGTEASIGSRVRHRARPEIDMLGRLTWAAIPFNEPLPIISMAVVVIIILAVLGLVTVKGWWPYLWREWLTSVDHKRIGVMYMVLGLVMLLRGFSDAIMMRTQQAIAIGDAQGYLPPDHYDQIFSAH